MNLPERRVVLEGLHRALAHEARIVENKPKLLWQQIFNRLQQARGSLRELLDAAAAHRTTPWICLVSEAPWTQEEAAAVTWDGHLPIAFSADSSRGWTASEEGSVAERNLRDGHTTPLWSDLCPRCRMLTYDAASGELAMVGQGGELIITKPPTMELVLCTRMLEGNAEVAASRPWDQGAVLLVTHPDHRPAKLLLVERKARAVRVSPIAELGFGYLIQLPLQVLETEPSVVCPYGTQAREVAAIDRQSGSLQRCFRAHQMTVSAICAIEERDLLVTGSQDRTVRLWRLSTGELLETIEFGGQPTDILWSSRHEGVILIGTEGTGGGNLIVAWDVSETGEPRITRSGTQYASRGVLSPDQRTLFTGTLPDAWHRGGTVMGWDLDELFAKPSITSTTGDEAAAHHDSEVVAIKTFAGGEQVVTVSRHGQVWLWIDGDPRPVWRRPKEEGVVYGFGISPDGRAFGIETEISQISWTPDGRPIVEGSERRAAVYPLTPDRTSPLANSPAVEMESCPLFPDDSRLTSTSASGEFEFLATDDGIAVRDRKVDRVRAEMVLPNRITCVQATRASRAFAGDCLGWVWQLEVR